MYRVVRGAKQFYVFHSYLFVSFSPFFFLSLSLQTCLLRPETALGSRHLSAAALWLLQLFGLSFKVFLGRRLYQIKEIPFYFQLAISFSFDSSAEAEFLTDVSFPHLL